MILVYGTATDAMIRAAARSEYLKEKLTKQQRVLLLLADGEWHPARELALKVTHRFGSALHTMKGEGVMWEKRNVPSPTGDEWYEYRLIPENRPEGQVALW